VPPRLPVDGKKVQELRITLGSKERQLVESVTDSLAFNRYATPIVAAMSDISFMATLAVIYVYFFPDYDKTTDPTTGEKVPIPEYYQAGDDKGLLDYVETQNLLAVGAGYAIFGFATGGWGLAALIPGAIAGTAFAEGAEEVVQDVDKARLWAQRQVAVFRTIRNYLPDEVRGGNGEVV